MSLSKEALANLAKLANSLTPMQPIEQPPAQPALAHYAPVQQSQAQLARPYIATYGAGIQGFRGRSGPTQPTQPLLPQSEGSHAVPNAFQKTAAPFYCPHCGCEWHRETCAHCGGQNKKAEVMYCSRCKDPWPCGVKSHMESVDGEEKEAASPSLLQRLLGGGGSWIRGMEGPAARSLTPPGKTGFLQQIVEHLQTRTPIPKPASTPLNHELAGLIQWPTGKGVPMPHGTGPSAPINGPQFPSTAQAAVKSADDEGDDTGEGGMHRGWQWKAMSQEAKENMGNWMPRMITTPYTPLAETLASPAKQSLLKGLLGAGLGGAAGYFGGQAVGESPLTGAAVGAGLGGLGGALHGYSKRRRENDKILDLMHHMPPGVTLGETQQLKHGMSAPSGLDGSGGCGGGLGENTGSIKDDIMTHPPGTPAYGCGGKSETDIRTTPNADMAPGEGRVNPSHDTNMAVSHNQQRLADLLGNMKLSMDDMFACGDNEDSFRRMQDERAERRKRAGDVPETKGGQGRLVSSQDLDSANDRRYGVRASGRHFTRDDVKNWSKRTAYAKPGEKKADDFDAEFTEFCLDGALLEKQAAGMDLMLRPLAREAGALTKPLSRSLVPTAKSVGSELATVSHSPSQLGRYIPIEGTRVLPGGNEVRRLAGGAGEAAEAAGGFPWRRHAGTALTGLDVGMSGYGGYHELDDDKPWAARAGMGALGAASALPSMLGGAKRRAVGGLPLSMIHGRMAGRGIGTLMDTSAAAVGAKGPMLGTDDKGKPIYGNTGMGNIFAGLGTVGGAAKGLGTSLSGSGQLLGRDNRLGRLALQGGKQITELGEGFNRGATYLPRSIWNRATHEAPDVMNPIGKHFGLSQEAPRLGRLGQVGAGIGGIGATALVGQNMLQNAGSTLAANAMPQFAQQAAPVVGAYMNAAEDRAHNVTQNLSHDMRQYMDTYLQQKGLLNREGQIDPLRTLTSRITPEMVQQGLRWGGAGLGGLGLLTGHPMMAAAGAGMYGMNSPYVRNALTNSWHGLTGMGQRPTMGQPNNLMAGNL
jgi:Glycine zipper